jgi:hypothetical protein
MIDPTRLNGAVTTGNASTQNVVCTAASASEQASLQYKSRLHRGHINFGVGFEQLLYAHNRVLGVPCRLAESDPPPPEIVEMSSLSSDDRSTVVEPEPLISFARQLR